MEMGAPRGGVGSGFNEFRLLPAPPGAGDRGGRLGVRCHLSQGQGRGLSILFVPSVTPNYPLHAPGVLDTSGMVPVATDPWMVQHL